MLKIFETFEIMKGGFIQNIFLKNTSQKFVFLIIFIREKVKIKK